MDYCEALKVFGIESVKDITDTNIKRIYRNLVKKWHPDVCGHDTHYIGIQDAYEILKVELEKAKISELTSNKNNKETVIINIKDILDIFGNKELVVDGKKVNRQTISMYNTLVRVSVNIETDDGASVFNFIKARTMNDEYKLDIVIPDNDIDKETRIKISLLDKNISEVMKSTRMDFRFNFQYISKVIISVQRVAVKDY